MRALITIGDKQIAFNASADTPRQYRVLFARDLIKDIFAIDLEHPEKVNMEVFEDVAYVMARDADPEIRDMSASEWFSQFEIFDIYKALPDIVNLWVLNMQTASKKKKKQNKR